MGNKRRRKRPGRPPAAKRATKDSRTCFLEAATKVFAEKGFRVATVDQVVAEAELSKGTFYWNFPSKEGLLQDLLEERIDRPVRALMEVVGSGPSEEPPGPLVSAGLAELFQQRRELVLLLYEYWSVAVRDERFRGRWIERQALLRDTLARALEARHERTGVPLAVPAKDLATAFIALAEGLSLEALIDPDFVSGQLFGQIAALIYDGLVLRSQRSGRPL